MTRREYLLKLFTCKFNQQVFTPPKSKEHTKMHKIYFIIHLSTTEYLLVNRHSRFSNRFELRIKLLINFRATSAVQRAFINNTFHRLIYFSLRLYTIRPRQTCEPRTNFVTFIYFYKSLRKAMRVITWFVSRSIVFFNEVAVDKKLCENGDDIYLLCNLQIILRNVWLICMK